MKNTQLITISELERIVPGLSVAAAANFVPLLNAAMLEQSITSRGDRCAFVANLAHESQSFTRWFENLNYKAARLMKVFKKYYLSNPAKAMAHAGKPQLIANTVYANRMGNGDFASGDGWRYRGRGPIGLTGLDNYQLYGDLLGLDLVNNPDLAAQPQHGFRIAALFWKRNKCDVIARRLTFNDKRRDVQLLTEICERINGGHNGLEDRIKFFDRAARVLGPVGTIHTDAKPVLAVPSEVQAAKASNGDESGDPNTPAKAGDDLVSTALNSSNAKGAAVKLWPRLVKHAVFVIGWAGAFVEAHKAASIVMSLLILGALAWLAYHNRKPLKRKLLEWLKSEGS